MTMTKKNSKAKPPSTSNRVIEDYHWADAHSTELSKKYPEKWIAIVDKKVVSHGTRPDIVRAEAHRYTSHPEIALHFVEGCIHLY